MEILANTAALIFGFWVFFPLVALQNVLAGRGSWRGQARKIPRNLLIIWGVFAFFRLIALIGQAPGVSLLLPEPLNTSLFLVAGLVSLLLLSLMQISEGVRGSPQGRRDSVPSTTDPTLRIVPPKSSGAAPLCPSCGMPMVLRTARQGAHQGQQFYGCPNFPRCRKIIPL